MPRGIHFLTPVDYSRKLFNGPLEELSSIPAHFADYYFHLFGRVAVIPKKPSFEQGSEGVALREV
jgi:hypothetical protein